QITIQLQRIAIFAAPDASAFELNVGKFLNVEKLLGQQMRVTSFAARLNTVNLDRCSNGRAANVTLIQNDLSLEISKSSPDLEPQISDHELDSRVSGIKNPGTLSLDVNHFDKSCNSGL